MALVDWVRHSLPLKLHDGKRHLFPTIASMVYKDDGETKITDENGLLNADKLGGKEASAYALADHTHNFNNETGSSVELDATLTQTGKAADAGAVGEKLSELKEKIAAGTPVKGRDYWTAADIAEIKSYVDDAILNGAW